MQHTGSVHLKEGHDAKAVSYCCFVYGAIAVALRPGVWLWAGNPCPLLPPQPLAQVLWTIQLWAQAIQTHSAASGSLASEQSVCSHSQSGKGSIAVWCATQVLHGRHDMLQ